MSKRKISRESAIHRAVNDVLGGGGTGFYSMRNIKNMVEIELLAALEKVGYTIAPIEDEKVTT